MIISNIELKKMAIISAGLEPKTITFNQNGWDVCLKELGEIIDCKIDSKHIFTAPRNILGLDIHFDMKQKEDFLIGVF